MNFILLILAIYTCRAINNFQITIGPLSQQSTEYIVYENGDLNEAFDIGQTILTNCAPLKLHYFKSNLNQQIAITPLNIIYKGDSEIVIKNIKIAPLDGQKLKISSNQTSNIVLKKQSLTTIDIQYYCEKKLNKQNYWAVIEISIFLQQFLNPIQFHYQYICDPNYHPERFDWSYVILIIVMSLFMLLLSRQQKFSAFKISYYNQANSQEFFQGFHLGFKSAIAYNLIFTIGLTLAYYFQRKAEEFEESIVRLFCLFFGFIFISELCYKIQFSRIKIISKIRFCDIVGILLAVITLHIYTTNDEPWILSNVLTLYLAGTSIKLFKITNLKNGVLFFGPCILTDVFFSIYASYYIRYEWDSLVMKYFNTPLTAQFPYFYPIYKKRCGWLSISSILFPAFFLAYAHRLDRFRESIIYRLISYFGLLIGLSLWFLFSSLYSIPLPVSSFTLFPTLGISAFIAFQRNEIRTMWTGDFYDQVLLNPWRHQIQERGSIHVLNKIQTTIELEDLELQNQQKLMRISKGEVKLNQQLFQGLLE